MKVSVIGWRVAKSAQCYSTAKIFSERKTCADRNVFYTWKDKLSTVYIEDANTKGSKKSVIAQLFYHAMMERQCES